jgi:hypothetical protein
MFAGTAVTWTESVPRSDVAVAVPIPVAVAVAGIAVAGEAESTTAA